MVPGVLSGIDRKGVIGMRVAMMLPGSNEMVCFICIFGVIGVVRIGVLGTGPTRDTVVTVCDNGRTIGCGPFGGGCPWNGAFELDEPTDLDVVVDKDAFLDVRICTILLS
jgi:hypothetical protein